MSEHDVGALGAATPLLRAAVLAPSMHNTQPWRFSVKRAWASPVSSPVVIEVHRDPARELPVEDPDRRALHISVGAVVFNLRVAAAYQGRAATVRTFGDPDRPTLVASVAVDTASERPDRVGQRASSDHLTALARLYGLLAVRRTNRMPFSDRELPEWVPEELSEAAEAEGARLEWVTNPYRHYRLLALAADAQRREPDRRRTAERARWIGGDRGGERSVDGIPSASLGPRSEHSRPPVRDLAANPADELRAFGRFEADPRLAVLSTERDRPADRVLAGQALQRVLLVASGHGLAGSLLNQALEHPDLRWQVRNPAGGRGASQAILRFGYGPPVPPSPRRPLASFLE